MPSLSINNDHGKSFTGSLVGMEPIGAPTFGASSVNGVYHLSLSFGLTIPDMSILSSNTPGQSSGIILSGTVKNKTAKTKETLSVDLPVLAIFGSMFISAFTLPFTSIGLSNPSPGDDLVVSLNYSAQGAYTSSVIRVNLLLS
tara:strand:+ start:313 stop:741 length:429 start_codon:yes stop_codon:yes gene_type:complete